MCCDKFQLNVILSNNEYIILYLKLPTHRTTHIYSIIFWNLDLIKIILVFLNEKLLN